MSVPADNQWSFKVTNTEAWSHFRYIVTVYRDGHKVADERTATLWGARWAARRIKRKVLLREPHKAIMERTLDD